ncbi:hypothetical protein BDN67DRAFT_985722 [Paxillus ammoniavirescens]|nr:hypothetical protein BDN67DRAFT_985722 [Paxillus ammoniavirescens]
MTKAPFHSQEPVLQTGPPRLSEIPTPPGTTSHQPKSSQTLQQFMESLGFKSKLRSSRSVSKQGMIDALDKGGRGQPKNLSFFISRAIFLHNGIEEAYFRDYFEFNRDWDFFRLDAELHTLFPCLFAYLDSCSKMLNQGYDSSQDARYKYLPPYLLCIRSQKKITIASSISFPTGEIVFEKVKAGKRPSWDESDVIFGKSFVSPAIIVEQWAQSASKGKRKAAEPSSEPKSKVTIDSDLDVASNFASRIASSGSDNEYEFSRIESDVMESEPEPPTIDLTEIDDYPNLNAGSDIHMASSPEPPAATAPSTPAMLPLRPPLSGSFAVGESLNNPWKPNHTFNF